MSKRAFFIKGLKEDAIPIDAVEFHESMGRRHVDETVLCIRVNPNVTTSHLIDNDNPRNTLRIPEQLIDIVIDVGRCNACQCLWRGHTRSSRVEKLHEKVELEIVLVKAEIYKWRGEKWNLSNTSHRIPLKTELLRQSRKTSSNSSFYQEENCVLHLQAV
jgi:hypothetical protein